MQSLLVTLRCQSLVESHGEKVPLSGSLAFSCHCRVAGIKHENALSSFCRRSRVPTQQRFANCGVWKSSCYFYSTVDSRAFPSGWSAKSGLRQRWLAAPRVHLRSPPMLETGETWLLLRHPRAPATSAGLVQEVQLQIRVASVGISFSGMLRYGRQSLAALRKSL